MALVIGAGRGSINCWFMISITMADKRIQKYCPMDITKIHITLLIMNCELSVRLVGSEYKIQHWSTLLHGCNSHDLTEHQDLILAKNLKILYFC